ncbi:MAG TPA: ATP-binding protein, partial [Aggregatilineales bacterium]|nr:ATP-binding protein [Aggregatilineales bacterium]
MHNQTLNSEPIQNPYVGPRPFTRDDHTLFFGRDREIKELSALVGAYSTVLLYAQSGTGKSSLINAGLIPALESEESEVLPPTRVGVKSNRVALADIENIYVFNAITGLAQHEDPAALTQTTLATYLRSLPRGVDEFDIILPRVIIFDQFEELFTSFPERWQDRRIFFDGLRYALEEDPHLSIVFSMRADYVSEVERYQDMLPGRLQTRFFLEGLNQDTALLAVTRPLEKT